MAVQGTESAAHRLIKAEGQPRQGAALMLQPDSPSGSLFGDFQVPDNGSDAGDTQPVTPQTPAIRVMRSTKSRSAGGLDQAWLKRGAAAQRRVVSLFVETTIQGLQGSRTSTGKSSSRLPVHGATQEEQPGMGFSAGRCTC